MICFVAKKVLFGFHPNNNILNKYEIQSLYVLMNGDRTPRSDMAAHCRILRGQIKMPMGKLVDWPLLKRNGFTIRIQHNLRLNIAVAAAKWLPSSRKNDMKSAMNRCFVAPSSRRDEHRSIFIWGVNHFYSPNAYPCLMLMFVICYQDWHRSLVWMDSNDEPENWISTIRAKPQPHISLDLCVCVMKASIGPAWYSLEAKLIYCVGRC